VLDPSSFGLEEHAKSGSTDAIPTFALCFMSSEQHPDEHAGLALNVSVSTGLVLTGVVRCSDFGESDIRKHSAGGYRALSPGCPCLSLRNTSFPSCEADKRWSLCRTVGGSLTMGIGTGGLEFGRVLQHVKARFCDFDQGGIDMKSLGLILWKAKLKAEIHTNSTSSQISIRYSMII
jgi:hypothetical protein